MTASREFAFPLGSTPNWPSIQTTFAAAARLAVFLLLFGPAAASSAGAAKGVPNGYAPGPDESGEALPVGGSSETALDPGNDRARFDWSQNPPPTGAASEGGDRGPESDSAGDRLEELLRATRDPKWKNRWDAVNELGNLKDVRGIPALVDRALHDDNPHPRWRSLWAMSAIDRKGTDAVPRLLVGLESADPTIAHNAAVALAFFGRPEALPRLLQGLGDPLEFRRWEVVFSFREVGNSAAVDALLPLLDAKNEPSTRVRGETALVLGRIGGDPVVPALLRTLRADASHEVRWRAGLALASVGDLCLIGALGDLLSSEPDARVREQIEKTIAAVGRSKPGRECPDGPSFDPA